MIKATQNSERQPYDVVRQALKEVELDSSRRVELDDYVDVRPSHSGCLPVIHIADGHSITHIRIAHFENKTTLGSSTTHVNGWCGSKEWTSTNTWP